MAAHACECWGASLRKHWNALLIEAGSAVMVRLHSGDTALNADCNFEGNAAKPRRFRPSPDIFDCDPQGCAQPRGPHAQL
jgi:hypothetical protein